LGPARDAAEIADVEQEVARTGIIGECGGQIDIDIEVLGTIPGRVTVILQPVTGYHAAQTGPYAGLGGGSGRVLCVVPDELRLAATVSVLQPELCLL
jgi:hypothetical protein